MIGNRPGVPVDPEGGVPINPQDQTTEPVVAIFAQSVTGGDFSLAEDTTASAEMVWNKKFRVPQPNTLAATEFILLLDVTGDRSLQAKVISKAVDTPAAGTDEVTIDRPIDHVFPWEASAGPPPVLASLGRTTLIDMKIDGSVTPEIFTVRAGSIPRDFTNWVFQVDHVAATDGSKFCGLGPLANGVNVRIYNGIHETLFNIKKDGDVELYGGTVNTVQKAGGGTYNTTYTIPIRDKYGVVSRIDGTDVVQVGIQDDLDVANINSIRSTLLGHLTQGEV